AHGCENDINPAGHGPGGRGSEGPGSEIPHRGGACGVAGNCGPEAIQGLDEKAPGETLVRGASIASSSLRYGRPEANELSWTSQFTHGGVESPFFLRTSRVLGSRKLPCSSK